jgi:hypothetical protein
MIKVKIEKKRSDHQSSNTNNFVMFEENWSRKIELTLERFTSDGRTENTIPKYASSGYVWITLL